MKYEVKKTLLSFLIILLLMPLGHALMAIMEHLLAPTALLYSAFLMGFVGLIITIIGIYQKGDTRQTLFGITGAMLFWTGWVEFLFVYYAQRYGVHYDLQGSGIVQSTTEYLNGIGVNHSMTINGTPVEEFSKAELKQLRGSRPEYLIMPATFGMWVTIMVLYLFNSRTGCNFIVWIQKHVIRSRKTPDAIINGNIRPTNPSLSVFMEWNVMMWGVYLLLMFCYDPVFLGQSHPVTLLIGAIALVSTFLMIKKQLLIRQWGRNIRFALATVIVFWTFVEICGRNGLFNEVWTDPVNHITEMAIILGAFIGGLALTAVWKPEESEE